MTKTEAVRYLRGRFKNATPWIPNFRTPEDEPGPDDGPPHTIRHNGGPGGQIGQFDDLEDALAVIVIINDMLFSKKRSSDIQEKPVFCRDCPFCFFSDQCGCSFCSNPEGPDFEVAKCPVECPLPQYWSIQEEPEPEK